jgi:hypothetical protein
MSSRTKENSFDPYNQGYVGYPQTKLRIILSATKQTIDTTQRDKN